MKSATQLFEDTMLWLRANYLNYRFFAERDIVWTIQTQVISVIGKEELPYKVMNDYPILSSKRRSLCADIAILGIDELPELVAEFKYEPAHKREDIPRGKFPVVFWNEGILKDIERIHTFTSSDSTGDRTAKVAYALFIDEGSYFRHREPPQVFLASIKGPTNGIHKGDHPCRYWHHQFSVFSFLLRLSLKR